jgi:uncharacterized cupin superfamily protein
MTKRHAQVINKDEVEASTMGQGGFGHAMRRLGAQAGGRALGCSYIEVEPGKTGFPHHFHSAVEEALYILEGTGTLRIGDATVALRAGDYIGLPPGPDFTHQLTNDGAVPLRYLAMSGPTGQTTMDVVGYPDSKKVAFYAGVTPGKSWRDGAWVFKLIKEDQPKIEYYEDEPLAQK